MASVSSRVLLLLMAAFAASPAHAASEIAVAIRYLQPKGTSHAQIFLYREDGTLLRQLTNDQSGQMMNPVFASDGESLVFTRKLVSGKKDYWSVNPKGAGLHKLDSAPSWYAAARNAPYFTDEEPQSPSGAPAPAPEATPASPLLMPDGPDHYTTPDGAQEVVLTGSGKDDEVDGPGRGKHYELRDLKTAKSVELGDVPGFVGLWGLLHLIGDSNAVFLISPPLRVAFFNLHLNSTDGDTTFALDLTNQRFVQLSPNWAAPVPLPGEPAFLTSTEVRYVPIPDSAMTANSSYVDYWDAHLVKVRYARDTAAICYGASMYRPRMTPATVTITYEDQ